MFSNQEELLSARRSAADGYLSPEAIPFLGHSNQHMTFKKVRWALRFPLPPPSKDRTARRFSSTPTFRQGPRSGEALDGAIRVAAPLSYSNESSVYLPDSHFLKLPDYEGLFGPLRRNVNPYPPDANIIHWLRSQAPRLAQRDEGDKSSIPLGLYAFFCGQLSLAHVVDLIKTRKTTDETTINQMRAQYRANKVELHIPRLARPKQAILEQAARSSGSQAPPAPAAPHITPLPEGFALEPPATSPHLSQPASARGKAPKRPAPEGSISTASIPASSSGPISPAQPSQPFTRKSSPGARRRTSLPKAFFSCR